MFPKIFLLALLLSGILPVVASAQRATVTLSLDDRFFDALFESVFKNGGSLDFPLEDSGKSTSANNARELSILGPSCAEMISIRKESTAGKTIARLAEGKILLPMAFSGTYDPPLLPCLDYSGFAETELLLEFDRKSQTLVGKIVVNKVVLSGTRGVGSGFVARMVQSSIDKRVNPIEIVGLEKVSLMIPVQNSANISMRAVDVKHRITKGLLTLTITYEFSRS
jgi:hypothetical protein